MQRNVRLVFVSFSCALILAAQPGASFAQSAQTPPRDDRALGETQRFKVPALPVNQALVVFGQQAGVTIVFSARSRRAMPTSQPLDGVMTTRTAISQLLSGTGLELVEVDGKTFSIQFIEEVLPRGVPEQPAFQVNRATALAQLHLDVVVVTGTRRAGTTALTSVAGVDVVGAEELRAANTSGELVTTLSALVPSIDAPRSTLNGTPEAVRNIRFRGLNPDQLIVLVNGQRRHTSAVVHPSSIFRGAAGADINAIPQIALDRIEVLRDGAAAQYGSEAVTGVINFILKDRPDGGETSATVGAHLTHIPALGESAADGPTLVIAADQGYQIGPEGSLRFGGELTLRGETDRAGFDQIPAFVHLPDKSPLRGARNYHLGDGNLTNVNLYSTLDTGDDPDRIEIFGHATVGLRSAESAYFFRYPGTASTDDTIYPQGFRPVAVGHNVDLAGALGLRRDLADWRIDATASVGTNFFENRLEDTINASLGPASPTSFRTGALAYTQTTLQTTALRQASDRTSLMLGAEARFEEHWTAAGDPAAYEAGLYTNREIGAQGGGVITPADAGKKTRMSLSAFASLEIDVAEHLSLIAASRVDNASDYGTAFTGRLGANLQLGSFVVRASGSNNYRAPNLGQLNYSVTNTDYSESLVLEQQLNLGGDNPLLPVFGFEPLRPETSANWTLGAGYSQGAFQMTADAYLIRISDRIATTPLISASAAVAATRELLGSAVQSVRFPVNRYDTETAGLDFVISSRWETSLGELALRGSLALVDTDIRDVKQIPKPLGALAPDIKWTAVNAEFGNVPSSYLGFQASLRNDDLEFIWRTTRFGETVEARRGTKKGVQVYAPDWQHDLTIVSRHLAGVEMRVGFENIFDAYPDETIGAENYFGNFPYGYGRPIGINGRYVFASFRRYW